MVIGLTGGMGSGKSTVLAMFQKGGFQCLDCDAIVHDLLESDARIIEAIEDKFGPGIAIPDKGIDRAALGEIVFSDSARLKTLEDLLHPSVRDAWETAVSNQPDAKWVIEIPLLFEKNLQNRVDFTVCVFSDLSTLVERLERKGIGRAQALARIHRQMPLKEKAELADFVLLNEGSLEFLEDQVKTLLTRL